MINYIIRLLIFIVIFGLISTKPKADNVLNHLEYIVSNLCFILFIIIITKLKNKYHNFPLVIEYYKLIVIATILGIISSYLEFKSRIELILKLKKRRVKK